MKKINLIILIFSLIFIVGCWDKEEIEQRLFVSDIGVDLNEEGGINRFIVTYQYPNINAIGKNASEENKSFIISTPCSSIFQARSKFSTKVPFPFYFKHVKVLVLGEELLKEAKLVREVIDELNRDTKVNKKLQILVAKGKAVDIINANVSQEQTVDGVIYTTVKDNRTSSRFTPQTLTGFILDLDYSGATLTPKITLEDDRYVISGGCIIKDYKHVAWIDEMENGIVSILKNKVQNEIIDALYKEDLVSYTVTQSKSNKEVRIEDGIKVDFSVVMRGYLQGYIMDQNITVFDRRTLAEIEEAIEADVKKRAEKTINKLQKTYKADILGIGEHLSKFYPKEWKKLKENWDETFSDIEINVSIDVEIRRTGLTK